MVDKDPLVIYGHVIIFFCIITFYIFVKVLSYQIFKDDE